MPSPGSAAKGGSVDSSSGRREAGVGFCSCRLTQHAAKKQNERQDEELISSSSCCSVVVRASVPSSHPVLAVVLPVNQARALPVFRAEESVLSS